VFSAYNKGLWESGLNIYEGYSPNGPYGRHNRVWSLAEITAESKSWGFGLQSLFTVDAKDGIVSKDGDTIIAVLEA
jgi:hypothetical protein